MKEVELGASYTPVTEFPGNGATKEQIARLYHRYRFAFEFCKGRDVLEVACGAGIGLGYLAKVAKKVVAGDIDEKILETAMNTYYGQADIEIYKLDAQNLPFKDCSFDVVLLYEAIYYLPKAEEFISEAHRVLRGNGVLIIGMVNKDWSDFNPSPLSTKYFSVPELYQLLSQKFSTVEMYGAFPASANTLKDKVISLIKRTAVTFHLIPKTMKGKEFFKRIFYGKLTPIPTQITNEMAEYLPPIVIPVDSPNYQYKILYAVARNRK